MTDTIFHIVRKAAPAALALSLGFAVSGCLGGGSGAASNHSLESVHQPVVERQNYTLDLTSGPGGLSLPEQRRLAGWFDALDLRYGDRISIDDPLASRGARAAVEAIAGKHGLLLAADAPVTPGFVNAGTIRVIVSRSKAEVPGCPDWRGKLDTNLSNTTSHNYGCAVNSNIAAMVANPEHLLHGATGTGETVIMSSTKAIESYRAAKPTGEGGLKASSTSGSN